MLRGLQGRLWISLAGLVVCRDRRERRGLLWTALALKQAQRSGPGHRGFVRTNGVSLFEALDVLAVVWCDYVGRGLRVAQQESWARVERFHRASTCAGSLPTPAPTPINV